MAIKLIPRPIPRAIIPEHVFREIKVSGGQLRLQLGLSSNARLKAKFVCTQIQAQLGEGHVSIVDAKEAILTEKHLALSMEYAAGGSLTAYVSQRWQHATHTGMFLGEDEARYFFRVSNCCSATTLSTSFLVGSRSRVFLAAIHQCSGVLPFPQRGAQRPEA